MAWTLAFLAIGPAPAEETPEREPWWTKERKAIALNLALDGGVVLYGVSAWGWGTSAFSTTSEGWFAQGTKYGGADKLGHAYTGFLISDLLADRYAAWGFDDPTAAVLGAGSSVAFTTLIEIGDGVSSEYGFSGEDLAMNIVGAAFSWLRRRVPGLDDLVDFRIEYLPSDRVRSGDDFDVTTDYDGMKHLIACQLAGLEACRGTPWRFIEFHVGYYTRGYADPDEPDQRSVYVAVGLDVAEAVAALWRKTAVFDYYQVPYTYLPATHALGP